MIVNTSSLALSSDDVLPPNPTPPLPSPQYDSVSYQQTLDQMIKSCSDDACRYWAQYVLANFLISQNVGRACALLNKISEKDFALYPIVLAKRAHWCANVRLQGESLTQGQEQNLLQNRKLLGALYEYMQKNKTPQWLQSILGEARVDLARQSNNPEYFDIALEASRHMRHKKARITLLQTAVNEAEKKSPDKVKSLQEELFTLAPRFKPLPGDDWWSVGVDALNAHEYGLAIKSFEKVLNAKTTTSPIKRLAFEYLKVSYKALEKRPEALKVTQRRLRFDQAVFKLKKQIAESAHNVLLSGLSLARFLWTDHRGHEAQKLLKSLEKSIKGHAGLSDLYFMRGRISEEDGSLKQALRWMRLAAAQTSDPALKNSFNWNIAWLNYKSGDFESARTALSEIASAETDLSKKFQYTFWLGKTTEKLGLHAEAQSLFKQLIDDDPLGYYSLLAYRELGQLIPKPQGAKMAELTKIPRKLASTVTGASVLTPHFNFSSNLFEWLISVGEYQYAQDLLDEQAPLADPPAENEPTLFARYAAAGYYAPIFSKVVKLTAPEKTQFLFEHASLLFPKPYENFVNEASHSSGLWPEYIFSIMRQESSFNPLSLSNADAYGLLQLLPSVGKQLASQLHLNYAKSTDLLDPKLNITLGAQHLRNYWNEFDGQFILTTAAYNASPNSVKAWVKTRFKGDALQFIEDIPYEETRTYVKLVLRNFIQYQRLGSEQSSIPFPEWCLEGIHTIKD